MSGKTSIPGLIVLVTTIIGSLLLQSCVKDPVLATLTTGQATDITINSAVISGNITDNGRAEITARGFCWGLNPQPTLDDEFVPSGTGSGVHAESDGPGNREYGNRVAGLNRTTYLQYVGRLYRFVRLDQW